MKLPKKKFLIVLVVVLLLGPAAFVILKSDRAKPVRKAVRRQWLILTGGLVDVGGYRLRIECKGAGSPTVVMDAGLNMTLNTWGSVPEETAKFTRVCIYERAGLGESDKSPKSPRTSEDVVRDLHMLLQNAGVKSPFLLVGHSFGGINVRLYASRYPQEIAGLVLVDASHEDQYERLAALKSAEEGRKYLEHEGGGNNEGIDLLAGADMMRNAPPLPDIPLIVLSAHRNDPQEMAEMQVHDDLQAALARLNNNGKLVVADDCGHFIQLERPEMVIKAIREVYEKTSKPAQ